MFYIYIVTILCRSHTHK